MLGFNFDILQSTSAELTTRTIERPKVKRPNDQMYSTIYEIECNCYLQVRSKMLIFPYRVYRVYRVLTF